MLGESKALNALALTLIVRFPRNNFESNMTHTSEILSFPAESNDNKKLSTPSEKKVNQCCVIMLS